MSVYCIRSFLLLFSKVKAQGHEFLIFICHDTGLLIAHTSEQEVASLGVAAQMWTNREIRYFPISNQSCRHILNLPDSIKLYYVNAFSVSDLCCMSHPSFTLPVSILIVYCLSLPSLMSKNNLKNFSLLLLTSSYF